MQPVRGKTSSHPSCATFWSGGDLGPVERACMRSVLRQGHALALYCYGELPGVPDGVEVRDAAAILSRSAAFEQNGSLAAFSDWFRYALLERGLGTWIDADVYLVRPIPAEPETLFGEEAPGIINNAVLRLPQSSPILRDLLEIFRRGSTPPWLPWRAYVRARAQQLFRGAADLTRLPWGTMGPLAISALAARYRLADQALAPDIFYPVPWRRADWIADPQIALGSVTSDRTIGVHLWNACITTFKNSPPPPGSFLERLHREGAL